MFDPNKANIISAADIVVPYLGPEGFILNPYMLPRGGQWLIAGDQEIGKTWLCLNIIRSLVWGDPLFDNPDWPVTPSKVLFVEPEVGLTLPERMDHAFQDRPQLETRGRFDYLLPPAGFNVLKTDCQHWFKDQIARREYDVVILDSVGRIAPYAENDNSEVARFLEALRVVQGSASLIWTMHFGKKPKDTTDWDPLDIDNVRGASKWIDDIDLAMTLARRPGQAETGTEHESWVLDMRLAKTRHMKKKPKGDTQLTFNLGNAGRMVWREKEPVKPRPVPGAKPGQKLRFM